MALKGSYAASVSNGVDMFSGKLEQVFPLMGIQGRGEAGLGLYLPIRNTEWQIIETGSQYDTGGSRIWRYHQAQQPFNIDTFVRGGYGSVGTMQAETRFSGWMGVNTIQSVTILKFTSNEGKISYFRDALTGGEPYLAVRNCVLPPTAYPPPPPQTCSRGRTFRSIDGSNMTFVADNDIYDIISQDPVSGTPSSGHQPITGTLYLSNGTRIRFGSSFNNATSITDRNGNFTNLEYNLENGYYMIKKITDSLNR